MLLVRLPVNSRLLVVKFWGSQKLCTDCFFSLLYFIYLFIFFFNIFIGVYLLNNGVLVSAL